MIFTATQAFSANHSFYIGGSLSQTSISGKRNDSATNERLVDKNLTNNKSIHRKNAYGGVFAGYLFRIENFGIGPEFFYNYGKLEETISGTHSDPLGPINTTFDITHKLTNQAGANVRFGYFLDSYFLYTLLGIHSQTSQFYAKAKHIDLGVGTEEDYNYKTKKKNTNVFSFGFGVQKSIAENYAIGLECKFANFPNKNFTWNLGDADTTKLTSSFKYQLRSINLKLMYVF